MKWHPIDSDTPNTGKQILTGFMGQFEWYSCVDFAFGPHTGEHANHAKPTHWTEIEPPDFAT